MRETKHGVRLQQKTKNKNLTYWQFRNQLQAMPNLQLIDNITIKIIKY